MRKGEANFQVHSLNKLIHNLHPLIGLKADQGGCTIHYELSVTPVSISADETLFSQVIINLVFNAVDALQRNPEGQRDIYILPGSTTSMPELPLQTMVGLQGQNPEQLFESFIRARKTAWGSD